MPFFKLVSNIPAVNERHTPISPQVELFTQGREIYRQHRTHPFFTPPFGPRGGFGLGRPFADTRLTSSTVVAAPFMARSSHTATVPSATSHIAAAQTSTQA
jgi:hypothetical protein